MAPAGGRPGRIAGEDSAQPAADGDGSGIIGRRIRVRGQVQGVGFRPFVWRLAQRMGIRGEVLNDPEGVLIHATGAELDRFEAALVAEAPPLARVDGVESVPEAFATEPRGFEIAPSRGTGAETGVVPDAATCPACAAEIRDPGDRRHGYAFASCTHCGPRYTIMTGLPYDRARTTMAAFPMCPQCAAEYGDPGDRRFHAQPVACPACGPRLWLEEGGAEAEGDAIFVAAGLLREGRIVAVKGLGGVHLACDARNEEAVRLLRGRKRRPAKPFALMGTIETIRTYSRVSEEEAALLLDPAAPVVLLARTERLLAASVAPGQATLGWMLPYTPLHHLLLDAFGGPLVMTSGNVSGEPQAIGNDEARATLGGFADAFLMHDRAIARRLDDSVERVTPHGPMVLRRGRGRVPGTLPLPAGFAEAPPVVAYGGQKKAAICLTKGGQALLSHHLGELDEALTWDAFVAADADLAALFDHRPAIVAVDLHPEFRSTLHGEARAGAEGLHLVPVQHHHAHLAACLAENLWPRDGGPVAGIVLDGLGLGPDGTIWGGEVLLGEYRGVERRAWLRPAPLAGGDRAQAEPWRNALVRLDAAGLGSWADRLFPQAAREVLRRAVAAGLNAPVSSSAGRLFDAVAAVLGLSAEQQSYEGEAAMRLEALALSAPDTDDGLRLIAQGPQLDPGPMWHEIREALDAGVPAPVIARRFHVGLAQGFAGVARRLVDAGEARAVALSGGCFQNALLLSETIRALDGLAVPLLWHRRVPANDGGLALGQALVAAAQGG